MCKYSVDMYVDLYRLTQKVEPIDDLLFYFSKQSQAGTRRGKKMAGHMGMDWNTQKGLKVRNSRR